MKTLLIIFIALSFILILLGISWERWDWNKGKCRECGGNWRYFATDSQGGRGYMCDKCCNVIWVSYPGVDSYGG